jgi:phage shock protein C
VRLNALAVSAGGFNHRRGAAGEQLQQETVDMTSGKLRRSRRNRIVAGVCGGLAEFFGISSFWFRLLFFILLLPGGLPGLIPYLILWIIIPKER